MKYLLRTIQYFIFIFCFSSVISANNRPHIINLYKKDYLAANKNWSVGQDERGSTYFGNDIGLLEFDGIDWKLHSMPNSLIVRSVAVKSHKTIFTGGYEEFGRWDRDISGELKYTSISNKLKKFQAKNESFWKIWITKDCVYFQSFNSIYVYDYNTVKPITNGKNFLFLLKVRDELWVQEMHGVLYRIVNNRLKKVEGSDIFRNMDVRVILPFTSNKYLIGTASNGIYLYDGKKFTMWNNSLSETLHRDELNCGILSTWGTYFLGTILRGIYEVDQTGKIVSHVSSQNTLQNNTVLSLYQDNMGNMWAGLDRGIAYIEYNKNMSYFIDSGGNVGTIYGARIWKNKLFLATNQGVFYIPQNELGTLNAMSAIKLINSSQGQIWSLEVIDNKLYCGHNYGMKEIHDDLSITDSYSAETGVFRITNNTIKDKNILLLSTYNGLRIVEKKSGAVNYMKQIAEPIINADIDHLENIWLEHSDKGVYKCRINDDLKKFRSFKYYGGDSKDGLPYKLKIFKAYGRMLFLGNNDKFYTYDDIKDKIIFNDELNHCFRSIKDLKQIVHINNNLFWAITGSSVYKFIYDGYEAHILESYNLKAKNLSMINAYENIAVLNEHTSLFCLDNGFILYNNSKEQSNVYKKLYAPFLESLQTTDINKNSEYKDLSTYSKIPHKYNSITFGFSAKNAFASGLSFQYMLVGVDNKWSDTQKINKVSYARLPKGKYVFKIRTVDNFGNYSEPTCYEFKVLPPWYQTVWAYLFYILALAAIAYISRLILFKRYKSLYLQKIKARESRRLKMQNELLQDEIEKKNAELLTQSSFIIQKNEFILKLKNMVDDIQTKNTNKSLIPLFQKVNSLLNNGMDTEDDWKMFLIKFEQKHTRFFKKLITLYPQLTNNDLRLCACLKLDLDTKDIAALMNLSVRAIENNRYRLRKKLDIKPTQNLNEFFLTLE